MLEKDAIIPIIVRLMERRLANAEDTNDFDRGFGEILSRNPHMTSRHMETFIQNYRAIPEEGRRKTFIEVPPSQTANTAPLARENVIRAIAEAYPGLIQQGSVSVRYIATFSGPLLERFDPPAPDGGYNPGDELTLVGVNFSTETAENEIRISRPTGGPDPGLDKMRLAAFSATATELRMTIPDSIHSGVWTLYVQTPKGRTSELPLPIREVPPSLPPRPVIRDITPLINAEPGMTVNIRTDGPGMRTGPRIRMTATSPVQVAGETVWTTGQTKSDTECTVELPKDMTAGTYDIQVEGGAGPWTPGTWSSWSDAYAYIVQPGRYRINFNSMKCIQPIHDLWDRDADLVTLWSTVSDNAAWAKASSKYSDIGGGHPPVAYTASDGSVFTNVPGNFQGYMDVRYGLALVTELYDWADDNPGSGIAHDISTVGNVAGMVIGIAFPAAGAVITKIADVVAGLIPVIAKLFGYGDSKALSWSGANQESWSASSLQDMALGEVRPAQGDPPYTMRFGYGQYVEYWSSMYREQPLPYSEFHVSIGDWEITWRIERASPR